MMSSAGSVRTRNWIYFIILSVGEFVSGFTGSWRLQGLVTVWRKKGLHFVQQLSGYRNTKTNPLFRIDERDLPHAAAD